MLRLAFSSRTVLGKNNMMLWYVDVLAYKINIIVQGSPLAAALVVGMFAGLISIKSLYALFR